MPKIRFDLLSLWMTVLVFWDGSGDTAVTLIAAFLHEMGHVAVMYMNGVGIREIGITPYGFEIVAARQYRSFFEEISVSLAGCAVNFLSAVMLYGFGGILQRLAIASAALGILNIMPISCLDGGVTLNSMLCLGMLPVVGITLPFMSCGGSSTLAIYITLGMVHSIYNHRIRHER